MELVIWKLVLFRNYIHFKQYYLKLSILTPFEPNCEPRGNLKASQALKTSLFFKNHFIIDIFHKYWINFSIYYESFNKSIVFTGC